MSRKMKRAMKRAETISTMLCALISINVVLIAVNLGANPLLSMFVGLIVMATFTIGCCALVEAAFLDDDARSKEQAGRRSQNPADSTSHVCVTYQPIIDVDSDFCDR